MRQFLNPVARPGRLGHPGGMDGIAHNIPQATTKPRRTYHRQLGRYEPLNYGRRSWWRFRDDRTESYVRQVGGQPSDEQSGLIADMVDVEWEAKKLAKQVPAAETAKERLHRLQVVANYKGTLRLLRRDFRGTIRQPPAAQGMVKMTMPSPEYSENLRNISNKPEEPELPFSEPADALEYGRQLAARNGR